MPIDLLVLLNDWISIKNAQALEAAGTQEGNDFLSESKRYRAAAEEIIRLRTALNEVVFSCRTKLNMKDVARKALFNKPNYLNKGDDHASSDPPDE